MHIFIQDSFFCLRVVIFDGPGFIFESDTFGILDGTSSASYSVFISAFFTIGVSPEASPFPVIGSRAFKETGRSCGSVFISVLGSFFFVTFARFAGDFFSLEKFFGQISSFRHSLHLGF